MKKSLLLSSALVLGSMSGSWAGGLAEPVMAPTVVEEQASSSGGIVVPLLIALLVIAAIASSNGGSDAGEVAVSDHRLKEDIKAVGMTPQGLALYTWRYKGMPEVWQGVMAQDVAKIRPDALVEMPFGYKAVNYARLGLEMRRVH